MHSNINPQKTATASMFCKSCPLGLKTSIGSSNLPNCLFNNKGKLAPPFVFSFGEYVKNAISSGEPDSSSNSMKISFSLSANSNPESL